ncbi:MAG: DUF4263 domain-containing protein [bacterium]
MVFWKISHKTPREDIRLKIGRYDRPSGKCETAKPRSELTLDHDEFDALISFLQESYEPFRRGQRKYIAIDERFDAENLAHLRAIFANPNRTDLLRFIAENEILPDEIAAGIQLQSHKKAVRQFEEMLCRDLDESDWENWFKSNPWVLGSEFVRVLDERRIDVGNVADFIMQAYDGFVDIIEIKKPAPDLRFWRKLANGGHPVPSGKLVEAITQSARYIHEVERRMNDLEFTERMQGVKAIKPRCVLIYGRSTGWDTPKQETYRLLNSCYHNLTILTYDHVLERAKRILNPNQGKLPQDVHDSTPF